MSEKNMGYSRSSYWSACSYFLELQWKSLVFCWNRISGPHSAFVLQKTFCIVMMKYLGYDSTEKPQKWGALACKEPYTVMWNKEIDLMQAVSSRAHRPGSPASQSMLSSWNHSVLSAGSPGSVLSTVVSLSHMETPGLGFTDSLQLYPFGL